MNPNVYRQYERIRKGRRGMAIVEAVEAAAAPARSPYACSSSRT